MEKLDRKDGGVNVYYAPKQKNEDRATALPEVIINRTLYGMVAVLFVAVFSTYFVKDVPGFVLELRGLALSAIWLILACYIIGELVKRIFMNKARATKEYRKAKKEAEDEIEKLTEAESERREEYCEAYEESVYNAELKRQLKNAHIKEEDYHERYRALTVKEVKEVYPDSGLSKSQFKALKAINRIKRVRYNPSFLTSTTKMSAFKAPSEMYDADEENRRNSITSAITAIVSGVFGTALVGELIFSFSPAVLFAAVVRVTITLITAALKANFGWNCIMRTEISRFYIQKKEAGALKRYCALNPLKASEVE